MNDTFRLDGKVALVTGGSRGLGRGAAVALAAAGASVVVTSRSGSASETLAAIRDTGQSGDVIAFEADPASPTAAPVDRVIEMHGRLDVLVNNAGIQRRSPAIDFSLTDWQEVVGVNLTCQWVLAQASARHMIAAGGGSIINLASLLSWQGGVNVPAYAAAKHGVAGFTRALANEVADRGVNVNAIVPGYMATEMNTALIDDHARSAQILDRIPAGRWGTEGDVGGAVVFLASSASAYVHGHLLAVDGGWSGR